MVAPEWVVQPPHSAREPGATNRTHGISALRRAIEAAGKGYVLTVTSAQHLGLRPVGDWAKEVPKGG